VSSETDFIVRPETPADIGPLRQLNDAAFDGNDESRIIDALRDGGAVLLSLVAERNGEAVGHILFSPIALVTSSGEKVAAGLAPMAVRTDLQRQGVGSALIRRGLEELQRLGTSAVFVLGHPNYYPRFGFTPASRFGFRCEFECPEEAFMALELEPESLTRLGGGTARYRPEFSAG